MARIVFRSPASLLAAAALATLTLYDASPARADFQSGDIFLNNLDGNNVQQYRNGRLLQIFTGTGSFVQGAALTSDGHLVATVQGGGTGPGVNIFNAAGTRIASFATPDIKFTGDVSVFADGMIAICDRGNKAIRLYSQSGILIRTITPPGGKVPFGDFISPFDNTLYVADTDAQAIYHLSEVGAVLDQFNVSFNSPDLVAAPDGSIFIPDGNNNRVVHYSASGTQIGAFSVPAISATGVGLAPDAASLFVTGESSSNVYHYDLSGNLLNDSFAISNPNDPLFLTVVPNARPVPEPGLILTFALASAGGISLLARRRDAPTNQ